MTQLYTTLALLRQHEACASRYAHLKRVLGKHGDDEPIPLWRILETNGLDDAHWALRAVPEEHAAWRDRISRLHACDCTCSTPMLNGRTTYDLLTDVRSRNAIKVAERFALGKANSDELAAAGDAAWAAARAAARAAAGDAAGAAARAAAGAAARAAARAAAWDAAKEWQAANLRLWLKTSDPGEEALRQSRKPS